MSNINAPQIEEDDTDDNTASGNMASGHNVHSQITQTSSVESKDVFGIWNLYKKPASLQDIQKLSIEQKETMNRLVEVFLRDTTSFFARYIKRDRDMQDFWPLVIRTGDEEKNNPEEYFGASLNDQQGILGKKISDSLPKELRKFVIDQRSASVVKIFDHPDCPDKLVLGVHAHFGRDTANRGADAIFVIVIRKDSEVIKFLRSQEANAYLFRHVLKNAAVAIDRRTLDHFDLTHDSLAGPRYDRRENGMFGNNDDFATIDYSQRTIYTQSSTVSASTNAQFVENLRKTRLIEEPGRFYGVDDSAKRDRFDQIKKRITAESALRVDEKKKEYIARQEKKGFWERISSGEPAQPTYEMIEAWKKEAASTLGDIDTLARIELEKWLSQENQRLLELYERRCPPVFNCSSY